MKKKDILAPIKSSKNYDDFVNKIKKKNEIEAARLRRRRRWFSFSFFISIYAWGNKNLISNIQIKRLLSIKELVITIHR